ncbi:RNA polymerase sigma factor [Mariniflexile maritimum]|uniref:RNA polymerase sigma factor n=1 Tax=Mariniflexile maritimum TaxID=2682493 RepID=UPI0018DB08BC|nr:RNA polymerase sigma factor [Mariniflexile maritimum]HMR15021.1 RNA polymerase sigma factor [Mariniflexile sp.]
MNTGKKEEDVEIIFGCIKKIRKDQELLYKKYYGYIMSISLSYASNREIAQEIVDDTFMKVFDSIKSFDINQPFKGWLRKITINTAIDHLRKNKKFTHHLDLYELNGELPSIEAIDKLTVDDIHKLIAQLPDMLKVVFNLYELEGYNHKEIAAVLNIAESSSRTYLTRAKERLRDVVVKYCN